MVRRVNCKPVADPAGVEGLFRLYRVYGVYSNCIELRSGIVCNFQLSFVFFVFCFGFLHFVFIWASGFRVEGLLS